MSEEEFEQIEEEISEPESSDILENINENLNSIREELEKFNEDKFRENVRLAVIIVLFAVPISFCLSVVSSFFIHETFPEITRGGYFGTMYNILIVFMSLFLLLITFRIAIPLLSLSKDHQVGKLITELYNEEKKK